MNRRQFLKSLGALGLTPLLSVPALALGPATSATAVVPATTYKWAEMIIRTHNKCNLGMLERLLQLDGATAAALKSELMKNGVITSAKSACGMHTAIKPLYQELYPRTKSLTERAGDKLEELVQEPVEEDESEVELHESIEVVEYGENATNDDMTAIETEQTTTDGNTAAGMANPKNTVTD